LHSDDSKKNGGGMQTNSRYFSTSYEKAPSNPFFLWLMLSGFVATAFCQTAADYVE
jgi:hypothetical protein